MIISSLTLLASNEPYDYEANCQQLQSAFTIAIQIFQEENTLLNRCKNLFQEPKKTLIMVPASSEFLPDGYFMCKKEYEKKHPGIFEKNPAIISTTPENFIIITMLSEKEKRAIEEHIKRNK